MITLLLNFLEGGRGGGERVLRFTGATIYTGWNRLKMWLTTRRGANHLSEEAEGLGWGFEK